MLYYIRNLHEIWADMVRLNDPTDAVKGIVRVWPEMGKLIIEYKHRDCFRPLELAPGTVGVYYKRPDWRNFLKDVQAALDEDPSVTKVSCQQQVFYKMRDMP